MGFLLLEPILLKLEDRKWWWTQRERKEAGLEHIAGQIQTKSPAWAPQLKKQAEPLG